METGTFATTKRVCLVTGASGTLGTAFLAAHKEDYHMVALYNQHQIPQTLPLETHSPTITDPQGTIYSYAVNLTRFDLMQDMMTRILGLFGRVDVLVYCAVVYNHPGSWLAQGSLAPTVGLLHVNLLAPLQLATMLTRRFWRQDPAVNGLANRNIVAVSSVSGLNVYPGGQELYSASKAGMNMLIRHLAENLAPFDVRANVICPDTFPAVIPTETVVAQIRTCAEGTMTGQVIPVTA